MKKFLWLLFFAPFLALAQPVNPISNAQFNGTNTVISGASLGPAGTGTVTATGIKSATTTVSASAATAPTSGQTLTATSGTTATWQNPAHSVSFTVNGNGSALTTGVQAAIVNSTYGGTLSSWSVTASPADTITFDILRSADGAAAPSVSIVGAGTKPNLAANVNSHSTSFAGWTSTAITAFDNFKVQITAVGGTATVATVTLNFQ